MVSYSKLRANVNCHRMYLPRLNLIPTLDYTDVCKVLPNAMNP